MVTLQLTTAWPQLIVKKWTFTLVNSHFSPQSGTMQWQPEKQQTLMITK
jgi:hypothetical protein